MGIDPFGYSMKMLLSLLLSMSIFTACRGNDTLVPSYYIPEKTIQNISYGSDSAQRMDIYLPAGRSSGSTKALILIHGGGWNSGSKSDFTSYIDSFRKRMPAYAIFNIDYRLVSGNHLFPTQENDIRAAMNFIASQSAEYQVNKDQMILLGASAGAHLALLQAYKYKDPKVKAVIDFFGPTDLTTMYYKPWNPLVTYALKMITGTTPLADPELYHQSSPINFVTGQSAPTLILHGSNDQVVNLSQSKALKQELKKAGVKHELVVYQGQRHGWKGSLLSNSFDRIEAFLETNVK